MATDIGLQGLSLEEEQGVPLPPTPDDVLTFAEPTPGYCCSLMDNIYGIEFDEFKIRDCTSGMQLFSVQRDPDQPELDLSNLTPDIEDQVRCISYDFGHEFLSLSTIGTTLVFSVGPKEVPNFRMIERHYFRNKLVKSFDFNFGFCIPNSTNTWEAIYDMPALDPELMEEMIACPWETESDSFYFVDDTMIMHNKAKYAYNRPDPSLEPEG